MTGQTLRQDFNDKELQKAFLELDNLVGLKKQKKMLKEMIQNINNHQCYNMVFRGNSHTGKTTLARVMSKLLHAGNIVDRNHIEEIDLKEFGSESSLSDRKIENHIKKILKNAEGAVLLIKNIPKTITENQRILLRHLPSFMEGVNSKNRSSVIIAGNSEQLYNLFDQHPTIIARMNVIDEFSSYSGKELKALHSLKETKKPKYPRKPK